jgi:hypothetical protein
VGKQAEEMIGKLIEQGLRPEEAKEIALPHQRGNSRKGILSDEHKKRLRENGRLLTFSKIRNVFYPGPSAASELLKSHSKPFKSRPC